MPTEAQILLKEIQYRTGKTLDEIAEDINYSRPYLNNVKLKGGGKKIIHVLKQQYKKQLNELPTITDLLPPSDASLVDLIRAERELSKAAEIIKKRISKIVDKPGTK